MSLLPGGRPWQRRAADHPQPCPTDKEFCHARHATPESFGSRHTQASH